MQLKLGYNPSPLTCLVCGLTGATLPAVLDLGYTFEYQGKTRRAMAYGYKHEGCQAQEMRQWT